MWGLSSDSPVRSVKRLLYDVAYRSTDTVLWIYPLAVGGVAMAVSQRDGGYRLLWPEFGGLSVLVLLPFVYLLVRITSQSLAEQFAPVFPELFPEPFTTVVTASLWAGAAIVVVYFIAADALVTIRQFDERDELEGHIAAWAPDRRFYTLAAARFVAGVVLVVVSGRGFVPAFERLLDLAVIFLAEFERTFTAIDALWLGLFFVGYVLFAGGMDRLVVSGARELLQRKYCE